MPFDLSPGAGVTAVKSGWYAVQTMDGTVGLVNHTSGSTFNLGAGQAPVSSATWIADSSTIAGPVTAGELLSKDGPGVQAALVKLGATADQMTKFITQVDTAAVKTPSLRQLLIPTSGTPTAGAGSGNPISTTPSGDVTATGLGVPGLGGLDGIAAALTKIADLLTSSATWIRVLEGIGAVFLLYLGLHALTGQSSSVGDQAKHVKTKIRVVPV